MCLQRHRQRMAILFLLRRLRSLFLSAPGYPRARKNKRRPRLSFSLHNVNQQNPTQKPAKNQPDTPLRIPSSPLPHPGSERPKHHSTLKHRDPSDTPAYRPLILTLSSGPKQKWDVSDKHLTYVGNQPVTVSSRQPRRHTAATVLDGLTPSP